MPRKSSSSAQKKGTGVGGEVLSESQDATIRRSSRSSTKGDAQSPVALEGGRSRRSSTAAQTAASVADAHRTRSKNNQMPEDVTGPLPLGSSGRRSRGLSAGGGDALESSPATRVKNTRRSSGRVNYEESEGEDDDDARCVGKQRLQREDDEDDYDIDEDVENDSDSVESGKGRPRARSSAKGRGVRGGRGRGQSSPGKRRRGRGRPSKSKVPAAEKASYEPGVVTCLSRRPGRPRKEPTEIQVPAEEEDDGTEAGVGERRPRRSSTRQSQQVDEASSSPVARPVRSLRKSSGTAASEQPGVRQRPVRSTRGKPPRDLYEDDDEVDEARGMEETVEEEKVASPSRGPKRKRTEAHEVVDGTQPEPPRKRPRPLEEEEAEDSGVSDKRRGSETRTEAGDRRKGYDLTSEVRDDAPKETEEEEPMEVDDDSSELQGDDGADVDASEKQHADGEVATDTKGEVTESALKDSLRAATPGKDEDAAAENKVPEDSTKEEGPGMMTTSGSGGEPVTKFTDGGSDVPTEAAAVDKTKDDSAKSSDETTAPPTSAKTSVIVSSSVPKNEECPPPAMTQFVPWKPSVSRCDSDEAKSDTSSARDENVRDESSVVPTETGPASASVGESSSSESKGSSSSTGSTADVDEEAAVGGAATVVVNGTDCEEHGENVTVLAKPHATIECDSSASKANGASDAMPGPGRKYVYNRAVSEDQGAALKERTYGFASYHVSETMTDAVGEKLLREMKDLDADVICLQGVPKRRRPQSEHHFAAGIDALGYKSLEDFGDDEEDLGLVTLYRSSSFRLVDHVSISVDTALRKDLETSTLSEDEREAVGKFVPKCGRCSASRLSAVASDGKMVNVVNVHLPRLETSAHALQVSCLAREVAGFGMGGGPTANVMCGVFNMSEDQAAYQLLRDGYLSNDMIEDLQKRKDVPIPRKENAALVNLLWKSFQHPVSSLQSCYRAVLGHELKLAMTEDGGNDVTMKGGTSPYLMWLSTDSLIAVGVLDVAGSSSLHKEDNVHGVSSHGTFLKADIAFK